ncbi:hypothetical protein SNE40_013924 [Patella caerulea]|uniref:Uncharacterized protein n=1 Tax=Patella caerulea TaxID=87958 RepID=A0AAN8JFZ9_PATCE
MPEHGKLSSQSSKHTLKCRNMVVNENDLIDLWVGLFGEFSDDDIDDEVFISLLLDLFGAVTKHYIKTPLVYAIKECKQNIPREKTILEIKGDSAWGTCEQKAEETAPSASTSVRSVTATSAIN